MAVAKTSELLFEAAQDLEDLILPENAHFNMRIWGKHAKGPMPKLVNLCGTSACAAGWLSLNLKWRERGLSSTWLKLDSGRWSLKADRGLSFFGLCANVLQITYSESFHIFGRLDDSREEVIESLRTLAKQYKGHQL